MRAAARKTRAWWFHADRSPLGTRVASVGGFVRVKRAWHATLGHATSATTMVWDTWQCVCCARKTDPPTANLRTRITVQEGCRRLPQNSLGRRHELREGCGWMMGLPHDQYRGGVDAKCWRGRLGGVAGMLVMAGSVRTGPVAGMLHPLAVWPKRRLRGRRPHAYPRWPCPRALRWRKRMWTTAHPRRWSGPHPSPLLGAGRTIEPVSTKQTRLGQET